MKEFVIRGGVCPLCGKSYSGRPAVSRTDNQTPICPDCGTRQALASIDVNPDEQEEIIRIIHKCGPRNGG